jgi:hypothetical protein
VFGPSACGAEARLKSVDASISALLHLARVVLWMMKEVKHLQCSQGSLRKGFL